MNTQRRKIKLSLAFIIVFGALIVLAIAFKNWVLIGLNPLEVGLESTIKGAYQQYMMYIQGDNPNQNTVIRYSVPFILFFITISSLSIIILFILLIIRRTQKLKQETIDQMRINKVQNLIVDYLYDENPETLKQLELERKSEVIDQLVILYDSIIGNKAELVKKLFLELKLDEFVSNKINSSLWHVKMKYINVAATFDVASVTEKVRKNINSNNWNVRNAAQLALITLDRTHSFDFLHYLEKPLSKWQQISLHHLIVRQSIPIPNFSDFIISQNTSVVIFGLSMIEAFNQKENAQGVIRLLSHQDSEIRHQALHTIKELALKDAAPILIGKFNDENHHIQLDIIEALANFDTKESVAFLSSLLPKNDFEINMAIIKNMSPASLNKELETITITPEIEKMLRQVAY